MLGYDIEFGHLEVLHILSSSEFSNKQIGYLAASLLLHETHEMIPLVIHSFLSDLNSTNELFQGMALSAIGSIGGKEMAESLAPSIEKILLSKTTKTVVRKKAALGLLKLWRRQPGVIQIETWPDRKSVV